MRLLLAIAAAAMLTACAGRGVYVPAPGTSAEQWRAISTHVGRARQDRAP